MIKSTTKAKIFKQVMAKKADERNEQFNDKYPSRIIIGVGEYEDSESVDSLSNEIVRLTLPIPEQDWDMLETSPRGRVVAIYTLEKLVEVRAVKKLIMTDGDGVELRIKEKPL